MTPLWYTLIKKYSPYFLYNFLVLWFCPNWFRWNQMVMAWRHLMWFFMAQRPYKNYGIVVGWKCSYSWVIFTIHTYLDPPRVHTRFIFQASRSFFCWVFGVRFHTQLGPRQLRTVSCCHAALAVALVLTWRWATCFDVGDTFQQSLQLWLGWKITIHIHCH